MVMGVLEFETALDYAEAANERLQWRGDDRPERWLIQTLATERG